jgi:hypothetical protein
LQLWLLLDPEYKVTWEWIILCILEVKEVKKESKAITVTGHGDL